MKKSANMRSAGSAPTSVAFKLSPVAAGCAVLLSALAGSSYAQQNQAPADSAQPLQTVKRSPLKTSASCQTPPSLNRWPACQA